MSLTEYLHPGFQTESVKTERVYLETIDAHDYRSYWQRIVAAQLDVMDRIPELRWFEMGGDRPKNQRGRLIYLFYTMLIGDFTLGG